ncbi:MAG TPA: hypothetical protein VFO34_06735 [Candidatus Acidoferrales bacterium]|nr:hypothetical protein [Candidatus Acidoferrales bacterium]
MEIGSHKPTLREKWHAVSLNNKFIVIFAGVSAFATLAYSGFAGWQLIEIRRGSKDTHELAEAAKRQAEKAEAISNSADKAAEAMRTNNSQSKDALEKTLAQSKAALDASIKSFRNDQRAWVSVLDTRLDREPVIAQELIVRYALANTGKTPAMHVGVKTGIFLSAGEPIKSDWENDKLTNPNGVLFPASINRSGSISLDGGKISFATLQAYQSHLTAIYLRVRVEYDDVFGGHHWIETCSVHGSGEPLEYFNGCTILKTTIDGEITR